MTISLLLLGNIPTLRVHVGVRLILSVVGQSEGGGWICGNSLEV